MSAMHAKLKNFLEAASGKSAGENLYESQAQIEIQSEKLSKAGISLVTIGDNSYPGQLKRVLGNKAPKYLFYKGNISLADMPQLGFCGSRKASQRGLDVCTEIVKETVEIHAGVTAGYAAGIDQCAHATALDLKGHTIAVLAEGIMNFTIREILRDKWDWDKALVVSEFLPDARWTVGRAMQRNRTIIGLSRALVVIEAGEKGGTFEAGKAALGLGHPVFAPMYSEDSGVGTGNKILVERGAVPLMRSRHTGLPKIQKIRELLSSAS